MSTSSTRFPRRVQYGSSYSIMMSSLETLEKLGNDRLEKEGYSGRRLMGYKLPTWQRPEVWTDEQCVRFIASIWQGVSLGSYMVNECMNNPAYDNVLLDGQQRLRAIERYWKGELKVVGDDGCAYGWHDLTNDERAHFYRIPFNWIETSYNNDMDMRLAYDRHNFGGTPHTEEQRASPVLRAGRNAPSR